MEARPWGRPEWGVDPGEMNQGSGGINGKNRDRTRQSLEGKPNRDEWNVVATEWEKIFAIYILNIYPKMGLHIEGRSHLLSAVLLSVFSGTCGLVWSRSRRSCF